MGEILLAVCCVILAVSAVFFMFKPLLPSALFMCAAMWVCHWAGFLTFNNSFLTNWTVICVFYSAIEFVDGSPKSIPFMLSFYLLLGAAAGMLVGLTYGEIWGVPGAAAGVAFGLLAYVKTAGRGQFVFSGSAFFKYFCAYGFRVLILTSLLLLLVYLLVEKYHAEQILNL